ncbi:MAG: T9SS type A sorting domain-containing protein [Saprospiraceae bacterium]|nr:T9SS type A sorting domain-containing protein [Saprospiraceae bacterium]
MNKLIYPKQITSNFLKGIVTLSGWLLVILSVVGTFNDVEAQCLTIDKKLVGVRPAVSGTAGNIDATYIITVSNPILAACPLIFDVSLVENFASPTNLGTKFVRVVGSPVISVIGGISVPPTPNLSYDGNANSDVWTPLGNLLLSGDSFQVQITAEINPRASGVSTLSNTATANYSVPLSLGPVSATATIPNCWNNCQIACNNTVHLSVNSQCEASLVADMVLEGNYGSECLDLGFYTVQLTYNGKPVSMPLNKSFVGKKLIVTVTNIVCGNSCWGNVIVEDKTAPLLTCKPRAAVKCNVDLRPSVYGFPVNPAFVNQSVYPYIVTGIDACGIATLTFRDSVVSYPCTDIYASTIYRKWCATDPSGFTTCCVDTIDIIRGTLADLTLPPHYDGLPGNQPYLRCNGSWTKLPNGLPDTTSTGTGRPQGLLCSNIQFDFSDDTIRVCDGTYKLLRRWLIIDWCRPNSRINYIQQIKVVDDVRPVVICPSTITISTSPHVCTGTYTLPVPQNLVLGAPVDNKIPYVIENCSNWTYTVLHRPATSPTNCVPDPRVTGNTNNVVKLPNGQYQVVNMPFGCNWIYYRICDDCGNCTDCTFDIEVKDLTPPTAVCQQRTVVALTENGKAVVPATIFDDRSLDNCEMGSFQVRRMNPGPCVSNSTIFASNIEFCCADIANSPIRVVLRVIDKAGNSSECMVDVMVQDKLPPRITCPKDTIVSCETDISNLSVFGSSTGTDNCSITPSNRVENNLNSCNVGIIKRWFIATDPGGRKDSCFQTITVRDTMPFRGTDIDFPGDTSINGCKNATDPSLTGRPILRNQDKCNQIIHNYEDIVFNYVEGVCFKVLRKWTVIDWCNPLLDINNPRPGFGIWYHTQVIKVVNNEKPTITSSSADRELCITDGCSVTAVLTASAIDDCTEPADLLAWKHELDINDDGTINVTGTGRTFSQSLGQGVHRVKFTVTDQCGNSTTSTYRITVRDCKAPTPYCNTGIITVIMPTSREVTIWAKEFNLGSTDNCTLASALKFSFTNSVADSSKTYRCSDIANGRVDTFDIDIYVTDASGNQDVCHTKVIIQDNQDACPNTTGLTANVSGLVTQIDANKMASQVPVQFYSMTTGAMLDQKTTNLEGKYAFENITLGQPYMIKPSLNDDVLEGVSTKDIVNIQKHILGKTMIENPYYLIAADVNLSGGITSRDVSDIRKLILGVIDEFPGSPSWNFVDSKLNITKENAFNFTSVINIANLTSNTSGNNFVAIKTGDVTGEAATGYANAVKSRNRNIAGIETDEISLTAGNEFNLPIIVSNALQCNGLQLELYIDPSLGKFRSVQSGSLLVDASNYSILSNGSVLRISWDANQYVDVQQGVELFSINVEAIKNGNVDASSLMLNNKNLQAEIYTNESDADLKLLFRSNDKNYSDSYELYQNVPNPFSGKTNIYFKLPSEQEVSITVYDLAGKSIQSIRVDGKKGLNSIELEMLNNEAGLLYYQLDAKNFIASRKMVIIR